MHMNTARVIFNKTITIYTQVNTYLAKIDYMGSDARKPDFYVCKQQRSRQAHLLLASSKVQYLNLLYS